MAEALDHLHLLMMPEDGDLSLLGGVDATSTRSQRPGEAALPDTLRGRPGESGSLRDQRWGLVVPKGDRGKALRALIEPLIKQRREDQGGDEVRVYEVDERMSVDQAALWKRSYYDDESGNDETIPHYLLALGDLHELPLSVTRALGATAYVGRLAFDKDEDYRSYADKVLRWQSSPSASRLGRVVVQSVLDGTKPTQVGYSVLSKPAADAMKLAYDEGSLPATGVLHSGEGVSPDASAFLKAVGGDVPTALFSLSHGESPPRAGWTEEEARRGQGAMSFGMGQRIRGDDLRDARFLPGGIWFMLACYGAGTPEFSDYGHWLEELRRVGQFRSAVEGVYRALPAPGVRPYVAALPKAVLASPEGPLGFMGHLDLAWTYSFQDLDTGAATARAGRIQRLLTWLLKHKRLGEAFDVIDQAIIAVNAEISAKLDEERRLARAGTPVDRSAQLGHLWMLRNDLSGYVVLGDPAVRLPLAVEQQQAVSFETLLGMQRSQTTSATPTAPALSVDALEAAVGEYLTGARSPKQLAAVHGLDASTMRQLLETYTAAGRKAAGF